ncbi:MAG: carbohydrate-binding family 9-like protein, partial [Myxococcaceae bacterium]
MRIEVALLVALGLSLGGCRCQQPAEPKTTETKTAALAPEAKCVPKVLVALEGTPKIDGELDEPVWHSAAATEPFVHEKANRVVPHTEARASYDHDALYVVLYVADAELQSSDEVRISFDDGGEIAAGPGGAVSCHFPRRDEQSDCGAAGLVAKVDRDGDVDANKEEDEEWVVELKVPWRNLSADHVPKSVGVNFSRLETVEGRKLREVWSRGCGSIEL